LLLVKNRREEGNNFHEIPHSVIWIIFEFLSHYYIPVNALEKIPFPGKPIEPEAEGANENDDNNWQ